MAKLDFKKWHIILLAVSTGLMGLSILLIGHHRHIQLTTDFYNVSDWFANDTFNGLSGLAFLLIAVLSVLSIFNDRISKPLGAIILFVSIVPLVSLLAESMWIEKLGGFPAIGSGQGVIKYFALLSTGVMLFAPHLPIKAKQALAVFPPVLVLLWIGGMKFTLLEAQGIEPLVASSPFMSWMYQVWDLQTTSNLIGVYDLIAVGLLLLSLNFKSILFPAIAMSGAVFLVTQTFLFTWDAALSTDTLLSTGGHFLIKDIWYLSNLLWLYTCIQQEQHQTAF